MRIRLISASLLCLGWMLACGGGGSSSPPPTGSLTLRFGSDSFPGYDQAVVSLEKVDGSPDGTNWVALGNIKATYDLMALQNGNSVMILPATKVTPGTYNQFRITWAVVNYKPVVGQAPNPPAYVIPTGGAGQLLTMPTTTIVSGPITVPTNGNITAQIMLSGQQAVQSRAAALATSYTFQATGSVYDLSTSARITGHLEFGTTPLVGAEVFAETLDGTLLASIQRRAFSDTSGNYVLEGLPTGSSLAYFVTSQPVIASGAYPAAATLPVPGTTTNAYTADLAFSAASQSPGSLTLTITPASTASQGTWGELRQSLSTSGGSSQILIIRSQSVATGQAQDQAGIQGLAPGTYGVTAQRSTSGATPGMKTGTAFTVTTTGGFATQTLTYP